MNELQECHALVWSFRKEIEPFWATPDPLNSLRYAFTEAAEAMDAWLRQNRPNDSRNNERQNDVLDELADCAIMLLTAVNPDFIPEKIRYENYFYNAISPERYRLEALSHKICNSLLSARNDDDEISLIYFMWIHDAIYAAKWIFDYPQMNLLERIKSRLARIAVKHIPEEEDYKTNGVVERIDALL